MIQTFFLIYSALLAIGGCIGFFVAGSMPSLISGGVSSVIIFIGWWGMTTGKSWSLTLLKIATFFLAGVFIWRFWVTYAIFPAGIMLFISCLLFFTLINQDGKMNTQSN